MKEVYVFRIRVVGIYDTFGQEQSVGDKERRTMSEDSFGDVVKHASALHDHDAASDLVGFISGGELLDSECAESMYAHRTHGNISSTAHISGTVEAKTLGSWPCTMGASTHGSQSSRRQSRRSTHGQFSCLVNKTADRRYITEHARVDGRRSWFAWYGVEKWSRGSGV